MTLALARWATVAGVGGGTAAAALWLRTAGIFSAAAAAVALQASGAASGRPWIGFDVPPLPVVLATPLALVPALRWDALGPATISATAAGVTAWWLLRSLRALGTGAALAVILTLAVAFHPVWLYAAASGSGSVLAACLLVGGLRLYERWRRTGAVLALAGSSFVVAFAGFARYDAFVVGLAVAGLIAVGVRIGGATDARPAFAIAYAAGVVGVLGLWLVVSGVVTGDALGFIARASIASTPPATRDAPVHALLVLVPAVALAVASLAARSHGVAAVATLVVGTAAAASSVASGSLLSIDAVVPLVPLAALVLGDLSGRRTVRPLVPAVLAVAFAACGAGAVLLSPEPAEGHRAAVDLLRGHSAPMWPGERAVADAIRATTGRVLLDPRVEAVPALLVGDASRVVSVAEMPAQLATPTGRAELVLVRTPAGRGADDRVVSGWPTLYAGGAPWASLAGAFPVSGEAAEYRLYRVIDR